MCHQGNSDYNLFSPKAMAAILNCICHFFIACDMLFNRYSSLYDAIVLKALKLNLMMLPALNLQEVSFCHVFVSCFSGTGMFYGTPKMEL